jgi:hypothetical protein
MTPATSKATTKTALEQAGDAHYRLMGMGIIALFPALFWTGLVAAAGTAAGYAPSALTLATIGASIATFLFMSLGVMFWRADLGR